MLYYKYNFRNLNSEFHKEDHMNSKKLITVILSSLVLISAVMPYAFSAVSESADDGMMREDMTSAELVKDMGLGWNLGDTLDVCNADRNGDGKIDENSDNVDETLWGNPKATQELFNQLKADGIKSVRIPITWRDHMGEAPDYKVDEEWMDRVQEVVDYARNAGMYVIINIHHDGGGDPNFGAWVITTASSDYDAFIQKYRALWSQIAERFKNYSDYLVFESMNEVGFDNLNMSDAFNLLNKINQDFVNIIRSSGGNNDKRHLLIAGYYTDIARTCSSEYKMPEDPENRCILSVHYYTPWQFCINGNPPTWGSEAEVRELNRLFDMLNDKFISNGVPVILGEYGVNSAAENTSRIYWCESVVKKCTDLGIATFFWDNGEEVDRETYQWRTPELLEAIKEGNAHKSDTSEPPITQPTSSDNSKSTVPSLTASAKTSAVSGSSIVDNAKKIAEDNMSQAKIKKLKVKSITKKKITVTWKKVKNAKGYNVQLSKKKNFKKKLFNKFTNKNKISLSKKIKSKKTYYIRVRAYSTYTKANGEVKKVFSSWNKKIRKVKVK